MATKIVTKNSSTASAVPTASDLVQGELAVNVADKRLFTEDNGGSIVELGTNPSTIDINAGSIDGTAIGASSASTGAFTTLTATGLTVDTDTLYVDSTNNRVGIGTTTVNADLHINKSSGAKLWITAEGSNPSDAGSLRFSELSDGNNYFEFQHNGNDNKLNLTTSNGDLVTFDRINQRVGIGTTAPAESIHTAGNIRLGDSAPAELYSNSSELRFGVDKNNDNGTSNITFYVDNSEKVRIDASGRVGIGTTSPARTLHLKEAVPSIRLEDTDVSGVYHEIISEANTGYCIRVDEGNVSSGSYFRVDIDNSEKMRIDSSGNVGIGTSSPSTPLDVDGSGTGIDLANFGGSAQTNFSKVNFNTDALSNQAYIIAYGSGNAESGNVAIKNTNSSGDVFFTAGNAERMRIDSSGNVLVGTTTSIPAGSSQNVVGVAIQGGDGEIQASSEGVALYANRKDTDGDIAVFRKDGTDIGSIGVKDSDMYIGKAAVGLSFDVTGADGIRPFSVSGQAYRDNAIDLGSTSARFDDIYATNGTIQTSDRNEKQDIAELSEAEQRVAVACKGLLRKFRWKDSVAEKGDDARIHFGIIAQDLQAAFEAEGLDAGDYAMFISTTWTDEETNEEKTRMGVRYSELLAFIISAI